MLDTIANAPMSACTEVGEYGTWLREQVGDGLDSLQVLSLPPGVDRHANDAGYVPLGYTT